MISEDYITRTADNDRIIQLEARMSRGQLNDYTIVFGSKEKLEGLQDLFRVSKNGNLFVDSEREDGPLKQCAIKIVGCFNKWDNAVICWHDGDADKNCEFAGGHWHIGAHLLVHPTRDSRWGRSILDICNATRTTYFSSQVVKDVRALVSHIATPPRKVIHQRGDRYKEWIEIGESRGTIKQTDTESDEEPEWGRADLKQDRNYHRIISLKRLMSKYRTCDQNALKTKIRVMNKTDWRKLLELTCVPSYDVMHRKAQELYLSEECALQTEERFNMGSDWVGETDMYLSFDASKKLMDEWCNFQMHTGATLERQGMGLRFDRLTFTRELFKILDRAQPKINTFMLQGQPSSGKSWILRSLVHFYPHWGEVRGAGNYNFCWQGCVDKGLIFCEEPMFEEATVEHAKQVLEGAPTMVNVKCKAPIMLQPTPVLITSNNDLWKWCNNAKDALMQRMTRAHNLKAYSPLKEIKKQLHPYFLVV